MLPRYPCPCSPVSRLKSRRCVFINMPQRPAAHYSLPSTHYPLSFCLPSPRACIRVIPDVRLSHLPACQLSCLHRLAASFPSLCTLFCIRFLCFQSLSASFPKTPGVRVPPLAPSFPGTPVL